MKKFLGIIVLVFVGVFAKAQSQTFLIKGTITDATSNETLIGASVIAKPGVGAVTDLDGNYSLKIEPGTYNLKINYVGYASQSIKVKVVDKDVIVNIQLESQTLDEVEVVANIGTVRETPVAISNISQQKIQEEIAGRDITMVMNSTPGVYASESGGGSGDSRVTLRGFDQTNIAVLVDGVPVNDMENGQVYWSNWDGLKDITKTMQIQRGLGATKLAVSSVGGTMNIITLGVDQKPQTIIKREYGNNNYQSTALSYNSGLIKNKFGIVLAGSYKTGDGWVQQAWTEAWSYFIKMQWKVNSRHLLSFGANGSPQKHGQRQNKYTIGTYSHGYGIGLGIENITANMLAGGVTTTAIGPRPFQFNGNVGLLNGEEYNVFVNLYHKPLFNLSHFWNVNDKLNISTVAYASYGKGGGTGLLNSSNADPKTGYINLNNYYTANTTSSLTGSNSLYSTTEHKSTNIVRASMNDHKWYGILSTASYQLDTAIRLTFGVDGRFYRGEHYRSVYDLLGGDYYVATASADGKTGDNNQVKGYYYPSMPTYKDPNYKYAMKRVGDKILYNYDGLVDWGGLFTQIEYKKNKISAFATATGSYTGYQRLDYFSKKDVVIGEQPKGFKKFMDYFKDNRADNVLEHIIGYGDTLLHNGTDYKVYNYFNKVYNVGDTTFIVTYTNTSMTTPKDTTYIVGAQRYTIDSKEAQYSRTKKKWYPGFTLKGGANYKINSNYNVYANFGVLQIAPKFNNVYNQNAVQNVEYNDAQPQKIISQEIGAGAKFKKFAVNVNVYYTIWKNRPVSPQPVGNEGDFANVNGLNASHKGIEFDGTWKIIKNLEFDGAIAFAHWAYNDNKTVYLYDDAGNLKDTITLNAQGVRLGNAAQHQLSGALKYYICKGLFIKPRYTFFGRNFSDFNLVSLSGTNSNKNSWQIPDYGVTDLTAGYECTYQGLKMNLNFNINNVFNTIYINDAVNNAATSQGFDANSASVFFGQLRRYVVGIRMTF
ncbi:MAG: TonB-dependent receptor [Bacteroidota bacterium]|nr:TonB-dependent receptor [Bacteroidota bacterium]